jgi:hypothetical protein
VNSQQICSNLESTILDHISASSMMNFWYRRNRIDKLHFLSINWSATELAMKSIPHSRRRWITKHVSGECGVSSVLVRRGFKTSDTCVRCGNVETAEHVWLCQHEEATATWEASILDLSKWLLSNKADPLITAELCTGLLAWQHQSDFSSFNTHTWKQQNAVGWRVAFEGCLATSWQEAQDVFLKSIKSTNSSLRWVSALVKKLWQIAWNMWDLRNSAEHKHDEKSLSARITADIQAFLAQSHQPEGGLSSYRGN